MWGFRHRDARIYLIAGVVWIPFQLDIGDRQPGRRFDGEGGGGTVH